MATAEGKSTALQGVWESTGEHVSSPSGCYGDPLGCLGRNRHPVGPNTRGESKEVVVCSRAAQSIMFQDSVI